MPCGYAYDGPDGEQRSCPREVAGGQERCVFHLERTDRDTGDIAPAEYRAAVRADLDSEDARRYEYVDVAMEELDLSDLVLETAGVEPIRFRNVEIAGGLDISGSIVRSTLRFENCRIGRFDAMDAAVERDLSVRNCRLGGAVSTAATLRRATIEQTLTLEHSVLDGSLECSGCRVAGWFDVEALGVAGDVHLSNATFDRVQMIDSEVDGGVDANDVRATHFSFVRVSLGGDPTFAGGTIDTLRVRPTGDLECDLRDAEIRAGHLASAREGTALYDLTDATLGDVAVDVEEHGFDHYRLYRTTYDGFAFPEYRSALRDCRWRLHEYRPGPATDTAGLERTYLEAKRGADRVGDNESSAAFFVREMRCRRRRYAAHARSTRVDVAHRIDAVLRWTTNGFLDAVSGYGEHPQRTVGASVAVITASALAYPAIGGLRTADGVVSYGTAGPEALLTSLYFSVTTFTTLGPGDVEPAGWLSPAVTAAEAFAGAFLLALFVFSLGRRAT